MSLEANWPTSVDTGTFDPKDIAKLGENYQFLIKNAMSKISRQKGPSSNPQEQRRIDYETNFGMF